MSGGGGFQKKIINFVLDKPMHAWLGSGAVLYSYRQYQIRQSYCWNFGQFEYERRVAKNAI
jgi:hypothetical protein